MQKASHYVNIIKYQVHDSVAQLDRAFDYESKGQGFESLLGHQMKASQQCGAFLFYLFLLTVAYRTKSVCKNPYNTRYLLVL